MEKTKMIRKRDGRRAKFDKQKIVKAVCAAFVASEGELTEYAIRKASNIADYIEQAVLDSKTMMSVEDIQDMVETGLMSTKKKDVAKKYILFREDRTNYRNVSENLSKTYKKLTTFISGNDEESKKENSNKDTRINSTMRDYIAGFTCREIAENYVLPKQIAKYHKDGIIHFHDGDYSPIMPMHNCCLINLEDMLNNGTVISGVSIDRPRSFWTAATVTTQISAQVASNQYGGQTINLAHLAPFVQCTRDRLHEKFPDITDELVELLTRDEIASGIQTIQYQLITMSSTNGQAPFCSIFMYLGDAKTESEKKDLAIIIEEMLKQRRTGVKNEQGEYITPAFPKLLYVVDKDNCAEDRPYWYLTKLAASCSAKRLVPDYISEKKMLELKGDVYGCMGCRSFLAGDPDEHKYWGRFNQGVVTLNLPHVALSAHGDEAKFWEILEDRLSVCYEALMLRHNRLVGVKSDVAPILWQHGALARLKPGEVIDPLLFGRNSSISLGYAGLWETVYCLTGGKTLLDKEGKALGIKIMKKLNAACDAWKAKENIGFSLYGSPIESTTYKFAKALKRDFGEVEGVSDKDYVTNSYHVTPAQAIDAFDKLELESEFQELSLGGAISYIETPEMGHNIDALLEVIKFIYDHIMYAEINTTTSYCQVCGSHDIKMDDDLKYRCSHCGNDDFDKMNIAVRICGYISTNPFNEGRAQDIHDRVYHLGNEDD